jgi:hypothetical protein
MTVLSCLKSGLRLLAGTAASDLAPKKIFSIVEADFSDSFHAGSNGWGQIL